ncbi:unnamed protein product, partial [Dovyalis caffra]
TYSRMVTLYEIMSIIWMIDEDDAKLRFSSYGDWLKAFPKMNNTSFTLDNFDERVMDIKKCLHDRMNNLKKMMSHLLLFWWLDDFVVGFGVA